MGTKRDGHLTLPHAILIQPHVVQAGRDKALKAASPHRGHHVAEEWKTQRLVQARLQQIKSGERH